jgi:transposase
MKDRDHVGIDVSAETFVIVVERRGSLLGPKEFANDPAGHRKLCRSLSRGGRTARVCLEASGIYHLDLALALVRTPGIEVMVANPRAMRAFAQALAERSKTDPLDAGVSLEFLKRMPFQPWEPPAPEILALRALSRRIAALTKTTTQEKNRLHAALHARELTDLMVPEIESHLAYLASSIDRLAEKARSLIAGSPELERRYQHLISIKGIAKTSATRLLAELAVLPSDMDVRQWIAHSGLDPRHFESGSSVHKPSRISKAGNRHLRAALYMPALVAVQHEPRVRAFYEKLVQRGKKPIQALVAVMRKLLHSIYGMFQNDQDFRGEKFYAIRA